MKLWEQYLLTIQEKDVLEENDKFWIQKAVSKHPGKLHKKLGVPIGKKIPVSKLKIKKTDSPTTKKEKVLAKTLSKISKK